MSASPPTRPNDREAHLILAREKVPLLIHQPSYSMLNRWIEDECSTPFDLGTGCIAFSASPGMLSDKYLGRPRTPAPGRARCHSGC